MCVCRDGPVMKAIVSEKQRRKGATTNKQTSSLEPLVRAVKTKIALNKRNTLKRL